MWTCAKYHSEEDRHNLGSMSSPAWDHLDVRKGKEAFWKRQSAMCLLKVSGLERDPWVELILGLLEAWVQFLYLRIS